MNLEPWNDTPTVQAIYEDYRAKQKSEHRRHLGGSQIGKECARALWYQFRHMDRPTFDGRMLRLFETGDREEERIVANLRAIGVQVWDRDPENPKYQIGFTAHGGHFALSLDGIGKGFKESGQPHTLEFKTMNDKSFKDTKKKGVQVSKPIYWAQCQVGMYMADLGRCAFIAVNKNTDEIYMERIKLDLAEAMKLVAKAGEIIFSDKPPAKLSNDPSFFGCKFCEFAQLCHGDKRPEVNCRTCAYATPEPDGTWSCAAGKAFGSVCDGHLFNPHAMPWPVYDAGEGWVEYQTPDGEIIRNEGNSQQLYDEWVPF